MEKENLRFAKEDVAEIQELAEQLASELNVAEDFECAGAEEGVAPIDENDEIAKIAEELVGAELPDDKEVVCDHDVQDVLKAVDELEENIARMEVANEADELEKQLDACVTTADACPDCGKEPCECNASEKVASEVKPGIEDEIGDEANGGDPSVSEIVDNSVETETDKEVFGQNTDSEYVAKITARLDRVANALEKRGMKRMAFRVDQLSDRLEASVKK